MSNPIPSLSEKSRGRIIRTLGLVLAIALTRRSDPAETGGAQAVIERARALVDYIRGR